MRAGLASLIVGTVATLVAFAAPALADPTDDQQLASINRRLSALTGLSGSEAQVPQPVAHFIVSRLAPETATPQSGAVRLPAFLTRPEVLRIVGQFKTVDRMMHYHGHGVDANFWGILTHGRTLTVKFSRTF